MSATDDLVPLDLLPEPQPEPERRGRRSPIALVALSIAVLLGAGGFALAYLLPDANTPEDAVRSLVTAVADEDVLGALDALAPSERDLLKDAVEDVTGELRRLDVLSDDADLSGIDGVDVAVEDLVVTSQPLADGLSLVTARGAASVRVEPEELPLGSFVEGGEGSDSPFDVAAAESEVSRFGDLQLVTVEEDGRWYVSLAYSVADLARREAGEPMPDPADAVQPDGEPSPERAVRALLDAGLALDARRAIALLPPDEAAALQDYAPLFLDELEAEAAEVRPSFSVEVRDLDLSVDVDGDEAAVTVDGFDLSATVDGERTTASYDGGCFRVVREGDEDESCGSQRGLTAGLVFPLIVGPGPGGTPGEVEVPESTLTIVTVQRGGQWYVSPVRTVLRSIVRSLEAVEAGSLDELFGSWSPAPIDGQDGGGSSDADVQGDLRNALTAFKVAHVDAGTWPTDPGELISIEPSVLFVPWSGNVFPHAVHFEVDGDDLRLVARSASECFYLADLDGAVAYARDPSCGPPASQSYGPAW